MRTPPTLPARAAVLLALALAAACGDDDPKGPSLPGAPAAVAAISGTPQSGTVGTELAQPVVVRVVDGDNRPVSGVSVAWVAAAGGGTVFAPTVVTGADGTAPNRWTLGTAAGAQRLEARVVSSTSGSFLTAVFEATAAAGAPAQITPLGEGARSGGAGLALADSLAVRVADSFGNPVPAAAVVWTVRSGGGSVAPQTGTTGADGVARAQWILGASLDSAQVAQAAAGMMLLAEFTAIPTLPWPVLADRVSGDAQTAVAGTALPQPLVLEVRLPDGRPLSGAEVVWSVTGGSITPPVARTDAAGRVSAQWMLGTASGNYVATASVGGMSTVTFTATATAGAAARLEKVGGDGQSAPMNAPLADSLAVRAVDRYGNPAAGVNVTWAVTSGGGSVAPGTRTTDAAGLARTRWTLGPATGSQTVSASAPGLAPVGFTAQAAVGAAARLEKVGGDGQSAPMNAPLPDSLAVRVTDAFGNPVAGVEVAWGVTSGGGSVAPAARVTDAGGIARTRWTLGPASGAQTASASAPGLAPVTFTAQAAAGPLAVITVSPDTLTLTSAAPTGRLSVTAADAYGNAVPVPATTWTSLNPAVATVDQTGLATAKAVGETRIVAQAGGRADTATVRVTSVPATSLGTRDNIRIFTDGDTIRVLVNGSEQLPAGVTLTSSNPSVATVAENIVTARAPGSVTISSGSRQVALTVAAGLGAVDTVLAGGYTSCALRNGGTALCWGSNFAGGLGNSSAGSTLPKPVPVQGGISFAMLSVGGGATPSYWLLSHTCGVSTAGKAYCWGYDDSGELGYNDRSSGDTGPCVLGPHQVFCAPTPEEVAGGLTWRTVSAGRHHSCGITTGGQTFCWGRNDAGQLATTRPSTTCSVLDEAQRTVSVPCVLAPAPVTGGLTFNRIAAAGEFTCALTAAGSAHCWGRNNFGQLGNGTTTNSSVPVPVSGGHTFVSLTALGDHACGRTSAGAVRCWGRNDRGQLGDGSTTNRSVPVAVAGGQTFVSVDAGGLHTCAVRADGTAFCWGEGSLGQLGIGSTSDVIVPASLGGLYRFSSVSAGEAHTCGRRSDNGEAMCWGSNSGAQLGNGSRTGGIRMTTTPAHVRAP